MVLLLVATCCGIYYAWFASLLIGFAALASAVEHRSWKPLRLGLAAGLVILVASAASLAPHLQSMHGETLDGNLTERNAVETEVYGLKLIQLALPSVFHRNETLRNQAEQYRATAPYVSENQMASIGIVALLGFLASLASVLLASARRDSDIRHLGTLNIVAFLYSTVGGLGTLFAWIATAQFRAPNRISILIAFISLCFLLLALQRMLGRLQPRKLGSIVGLAVVLLLTSVGIWDQTPAQSPLVKSAQAMIEPDQASGEAIMHVVAPGSRIYQLPYVAFPEVAPLAREGHTGLMRRYLHTHGIAWSYGAMKFSAADQWIRRMESLPLPERLGKLAASGFDYVLMERRAYADKGKSIEAEIQQQLGTATMQCPDQSCSLYKLNAASGLADSPLLTTALGGGYSAWEPGNPGWRSATLRHETADVLLLNPLRERVASRFQMQIETPSPVALEISRGGELLTRWQSSDHSSLEMDIELAPGINRLQMRFSGLDEDRRSAATPIGIRLTNPLLAATETPRQFREFRKLQQEADVIFNSDGGKPVQP